MIHRALADAFEAVEAGMDQYVLVVDDYNWLENQAVWGTDADRDAFWTPNQGKSTAFTNKLLTLSPSLRKQVSPNQAEHRSQATRYNPPAQPLLAISAGEL